MPHIVMAQCTALPGQEDALQSHIANLANAVRKEAGNEGFEVYQRPATKRGWTMIERYRDREAFDTHLNQPHTKSFNNALRELAEGGASDVTELAPVCRPDDAAPGVRGIDHVGITVPDLDAASDFLSRAFGARTLYDVLPADADPMQGAEVEHQLGISAGARIEHMRLMRIGASANIEMFRIANADQADAAGLVDYGLQHIALYVDDMDAAEIAIPDAPHADEIVIALALSCGGRPGARVRKP